MLLAILSRYVVSYSALDALLGIKVSNFYSVIEKSSNIKTNCCFAIIFDCLIYFMLLDIVFAENYFLQNY